MSCLRWVIAASTGVLLVASAAEARIEVVSWSHVEPCSVDRFELRYGDEADALDTIVDVGRPRQAGGHFSYPLDVPDGQETWLCVAAIRDGQASDCSNIVTLEASSDDDLRSEPAPDESGHSWCDDFTGGAMRAGWVPTGPDESLEVQPGLFSVASVGGTSPALSTSLDADDIHSHFLGGDDMGRPGAQWSAYEYSGQMLFTDAAAGVGVTLYSRYNADRNYYRLGHHPATGEFVLERARTDPSWKCRDLTSPPTASPDTWWAFRLRARNEGIRTSLLAKVWPASESEPEGFQLSCSDVLPDRQLSGAVGVWAAGQGTKAWDSLHVSDLSPPDESDPLGVPGTPELVIP